MNLIDFVRLIVHNIKLLVFVPVALAAGVYYLVKDMPNKYEAETLIYTGIASGYNIESTGSSRIDYFSVNNAFDNLINVIKAKETQKEVALSLLTQHLLLDKPTSGIIGAKAYAKLTKIVTPQVRKQLVVKGNPKATYDKLYKSIESNQPAWLNKVLNGKHPYYSYRAMSGVSARRLGSSDMITIKYGTDDAFISKQTLIFVVEKFIKRYKFLKKSETGDVVAYFEGQLNKAKSKLNGVEDRLKIFRENGKILNYYEQTKSIAGQKSDITDAYKKEVGNLEASKAVLKELEKKLNINKEFFAKNDEILIKKKRLSNLIVALALQKTRKPAENNNTNEQNQSALKQEIESLKKELEKDVLNIYNYQYSTGGIAIKTLLNEWLANLILVEQAKARVKILEERIKDIDKEYDRFAPLGSRLKKLEREVGVEERAYIEILHGLNQALIRQQNIELSSNLEVVDKPSVSKKPNKKVLLIILGFMVGAIGSLAVVIATELLDSTLKSPARAMKAVGLPFAGAIPVIKKKRVKENQKVIKKALINQITNKILIALKDVPQPIITITSTQTREGKSYLSSEIVDNLRSSGKKVLQINPANSSNSQQYKSDYEYTVNPHLPEKQTLEELIDASLEEVEFDYILLELPGFVKGMLPLKMVKQANLNVLVVRANRSWKKADKFLADTYLSEEEEVKHLMILNGVKPHFIEELVGDYGQSPYSLRAWVKRAFRLEFKSKKKIK